MRSDCAVANTLDIVGDRWSLLIVRDLLAAGELKYGELLESPEHIPTNTLADRLKKLELAGVLERELYSEHPPRAVYRLTTTGKALRAVVEAMAAWGEEHVPGARRITP